MYFAITILGLLVFIGLCWVFSRRRSEIRWDSVGILIALNVALAWSLTSFSWGQAVVQGVAAGFNQLVEVSWKGINFALGNWVGPEGVDPEPVNFIVSALLPMLLILPLFDTLMYFNILPRIIRLVGRILSTLTRQPKFETFYSIEMMFLGHVEAIAVSKMQLRKVSPERAVRIAMMTMSCVSAPLLAAYMQLMPAEFVLAAVPINCLNALIVSSILFPVPVAPEDDFVATYGEDVVAARSDEGTTGETGAEFATSAEGTEVATRTKKEKSRSTKEPYFSFLGDSILNGGKLVLIVAANVITFVAFASLINRLLGLVPGHLSLETIVGAVLFVPALLLGLDPGTAWSMSQSMGLKLVTNEFVAMGQVSPDIPSFGRHYQAVLTVFLTSFANLGTVGMIIGCFKGVVGEEHNRAVARAVPFMLLSGVLVSLLSAGFIGLFVW